MSLLRLKLCNLSVKVGGFFSSVFKMMQISSSRFDNLDVWYMIAPTFSWRLTQFQH